MRKIAVILFLLFSISFFIIPMNFIQAQEEVAYNLAWPGILPDHPFYKVKVLRNKIIERMIINPVKKVEFDLLMADKTIYASKLLVDKGKIYLARETVLKGENYYSQLVQDYNKALLQNEKIPPKLDRNIILAAKKHQAIIKQIKSKLKEVDKKDFEAAENFSYINYEFIEGLMSKKDK